MHAVSCEYLTHNFCKKLIPMPLKEREVDISHTVDYCM